MCACTHQVARLEVAVSESCERWVCLHHGTRLEPGDTWVEGGGTCHCSEVCGQTVKNVLFSQFSELTVSV